VTVANGQTTVTAPNIALAANAPVINSTLLGLAPAFGVSPTAPTPAQFDASTKVATMAAVQRALGNSSGHISYNTTPQNLTAAQAGACFSYFGSTPGVFNLPAVAGVPVGGTYLICNTGSSTLTVNRAGTDSILNGGNSMAFNPGDSIVLQAVSSTQWLAVGGSAQLGFSGAFAATLAAAGSQKLPSGFILKWGYVNVGTTLSATFPVAFPTACLAAWAQCGDSAANVHSAINVQTPLSASSITIRFAGSAVAWFWFALGY
jgi:hypothetical protein